MAKFTKLNIGEAVASGSGRVWKKLSTEIAETTISGEYLIDANKVYTLLNSLTETKIYTVNFSAGAGIGGGDERNFTSMTFNPSSGLILYDDKGAFSMSGGFDEYNNNYGDGNGARVNFVEGTIVGEDFAELFLSIADEYVAPTTITFTIEGASYTADSGMTWADWVASEYNTDGFVITNGYIEYSDYPILNSASVSQKSTDTIVEGEAYSISWGGSN